MIQFFRKIREKLLSQNRVTRYMAYAVGEIILVVIGILIAIQLNNWNNERTRASENKLLMENLIADLIQDTTRLQKITSIDTEYSSLKSAIENCKKALAITYENFNLDSASKYLAVGINAGEPLINTETNVYEQLKQTGRLYSFSSDSLRRKIITYYTRASREAVYNETNNQIIQRNLDQIDYLNDISIDFTYGKEYNPSDYQSLFDPNSKEMKTFRRTLWNLSHYQNSNYQKMLSLKKQAGELIQAIQIELSQTR
ncbi:hypothetical protein DFQ04_1664 [Algoriphagus boseongensis]|uniref:Uncharacterized protein n=1 Tax=Algoriphagus boseongensis TaxID=1442587 RepID=A0A4R6T644_9BACT|nr:DUF6090 family protein [Algoriphagus boseongensis]TDQ17016.1 hypothetical protein DFQ04_1664 [Algoriphagus boseongensis]